MDYVLPYSNFHRIFLYTFYLMALIYFGSIDTDFLPTHFGYLCRTTSFIFVPYFLVWYTVDSRVPLMPEEFHFQEFAFAFHHHHPWRCSPCRTLASIPLCHPPLVSILVHRFAPPRCCVQPSLSRLPYQSSSFWSVLKFFRTKFVFLIMHY